MGFLGNKEPAGSGNFLNYVTRIRIVSNFGHSAFSFSPLELILLPRNDSADSVSRELVLLGHVNFFLESGETK